MPRVSKQQIACAVGGTGLCADRAAARLGIARHRAGLCAGRYAARTAAQTRGGGHP